MLERFPEYEDVPLRLSPLGEVACQVLFSPIFKIETELPSDFQSLLGDYFPEVEVVEESNRRFFRFFSRERTSALAVTKDAFTLSTLRYTVWDDFEEQLAIVQDAMQRAYRIPVYQRIGLRYINVFTAENTGSIDLANISKVLRTELVASLQAEPLANVAEFSHHIVMSEGDLGLGVRVLGKPVDDQSGAGLFLDLDFWNEAQIPPDDLLGNCRIYHDVLYRAFRWSLAEGSLELFRPVTEATR